MTKESLLNHHIISQRYFFPRVADIPQPHWVDCGDARLACAYHETVEGQYTIVHFHGNGEVVADYLDGFPELLERMGCHCFLAEFRGYGGSSGTPQLAKMLEDVQKTIESIPQPVDKLILFGRSIGSLFAIKAIELFPDVAGLILESAIADPLERLLLRVTPDELGTTPSAFASSVTQAINIRESLAQFNKPALIMHTQHDGLIDVSHAERLAKWCDGPTMLKIFQQGNHNDIMFVNGAEYFGLINNFITKLQG